MFPDLSNVLRIREALWRHRLVGNAAIMVGAGFSRNASPAGSASRPMPDWRQMAAALCDPLYPDDTARRDAAAREASATSGFLRLAQEYYAAFGAAALNHRIKSLISDGDYNPGPLHRRLLQLPWADVFSTNWDTLLERACADVFERSYDIVRTTQDIPFTMRPRIVKLHGTLPSHPPYIFTEEDYRTYPWRFAPFVNLVQESMMENVFCLLGFSGDDPNFLHWSGWVRDNLRENAPKIYLVGWLELSVHRRRMLEARNVMPIDLSALPQAAGWPDGARHRYATEWFITTLEAGQPPDPIRWPHATPKPPEPPPPYLGDIPANAASTPAATPGHPQFDQSREDRLQKLQATVQAWSQHQDIYPGWLVAPKAVRDSLKYDLDDWRHEFLLADELPVGTAINALGVLAWRFERALLPFPEEHEERARRLLAQVHPQERSVAGEHIPNDEWARLCFDAFTLLLSLVGNARRSANTSEVESSLSLLRQFSAEVSDASNAVEYQECLWLLARGDLEKLLGKLEKWSPGTRDHAWNLRKAGLLGELNETARCAEILETTLAEIRRGRRRDIDDITALSLESWALFLALAFRARFRGPVVRDVPEPFSRWRALSVHDCDAFSDYQNLKQRLQIEAPALHPVRRVRSFDPDYTSIHYSTDGRYADRIASAYQMVLMAEASGMPTACLHHLILGDGLRAAAKVLADADATLATQLAIRLGSGSDLFDTVLSRLRVARLSAHQAEFFHAAWTRVVAFCLRELSGAGNRDAESALASAFEGLSRIAVRLAPIVLRQLFLEANEYVRHPAVVRRTVWLAESLRHLFQRILDSLAPTELEELLEHIFAIPLPTSVGMNQNSRWRDPITFIPRRFRPRYRARGRPQFWKQIVAELLNAARSGNDIDRSASILRLEILHDWSLLTAREQADFASAIWKEDRLDSRGVPQQSTLLPWVLLKMPQQHEGQALSALLSWLRTPEGDERFDQRFDDLGRTLAGLRNEAPDFVPPQNVIAEVRRMLLVWANDRRYGQDASLWLRSDLQSSEEAHFQSVLRMIPYVAHDQAVLDAVWAKVTDSALSPLNFTWPIRVLAAQGAPATDLDGGLLAQLRTALLSPDRELSREAIQALYEWFSRAPQAETHAQALVDLVREVGAAIASRRAPILEISLGLARWIFSKGSADLRASIQADCEFGLSALFQEARYDRIDEDFDIPAVRASCVKLALAIQEAGCAIGPGAQSWLESYEDDPLPEVRYAAVST